MRYNETMDYNASLERDWKEGDFMIRLPSFIQSLHSGIHNQ